MGKITIETGGGHRIDIVDEWYEVRSQYYILRRDLHPVIKYMDVKVKDREFTGDDALKLMELNLLKEDKTPF